VIRLSLADIANAVGGRLHRADGSEIVSSPVEFDSRKLRPGGLFVAVPGERVDGHDFAAQAVADGAVGVLSAREVDAPAVVVPPVPARDRSSVMALAGDTDGSGAAVLAGLAKLARHVVDQLPKLTVVGVTGSSGKTSTKDLIAQMLEPMGPTVAPPGSFNNEIGHPWTALRSDADTRHLVLELSARSVGNIAALCEVAPPRIGAVLNVGSAHLGEFGSQEAVARTKGELVEALPPADDGGIAVLNADDPLVAAMAERGEHHVGNALTAAAIALELGASLDEVAGRLAAVRRVSARRMEVAETAGGVTVVNDAYNANPESVRAALKTLASMVRGRSGRAWAVLGVMGELGEAGVQAHDEIGRLAVRLNIDRLVVIGDQARGIHQGASLEGSWGEESVLVPDVDAAVALLRAELRPGDVVLTKASKVAALWRVAEALLDARDGDPA
jgi:UDP-N-acetylmuramoyl-tripeptide--D-alanyl-D-alanine ligase